MLLASIAVGWITRSWISVFLGFAPLAIGAMFGYADHLGEDVLLWALEVWNPIYAVLIACGVLLGAAHKRRSRRTEVRR